MGGPLIYHGTPLTPRAALEAVMPGRAACVSFYYPQDLEAVLAVCPQVMFRPWWVQLLAGGDASQSRMGRGGPSAMVECLLRVAGTEPLSSGQVRAHPRQSRRAIADQRRPLERLAFRSSRRSGLAHGRPDRTTGEAMRAIPSRRDRLDRASETGAGRLRSVVSQDGRGCPAHGERLAPLAHAPRHLGRAGIPLRQSRRHDPCAERSSL